MITFRIVGLVGFCSMFQTEFVNAGGLFSHCSCGLFLKEIGEYIFSEETNNKN